MLGKCTLNFEKCVEEIKSRILKNGGIIFAEIDHSMNAKDVGLSLDDDKVIIFGNPKAGTILMQINRKISYDMPLRIATWTENNEVYIEFKLPSEIAKEYGITHDIVKNMDKFVNNVLNGLI